MQTRPKVRVGAVTYLNTKPLIYGLTEVAPQIELVLDYPSRLADRLAAGNLEVALIPSLELFRQPTATIISNACIACRGPVWSVKLFFRKPPSEVQTLALDEGSRTSVALAQVLLHERLGIRPKLEPLPLTGTLRDTTADAVLLIGDRAMQAQAGPFAEVWDLGDEWCRWSELPFVFAMWVARPGIGLNPTELQNLEAALAESRDQGLLHLPEIAATEAAPLGLTRPECIAYLRDNLYFFLGTRELAGLNLFRRKAAELGLAPQGDEYALANCQSA